MAAALLEHAPQLAWQAVHDVPFWNVPTGHSLKHASPYQRLPPAMQEQESHTSHAWLVAFW